MNAKEKIKINTTIEARNNSVRVGHETLFISASTAIRKSAKAGTLTNRKRRPPTSRQHQQAPPGDSVLNRALAHASWQADNGPIARNTMPAASATCHVIQHLGLQPLGASYTLSLREATALA